MNVFSVFDGISCGRIALDRANIKVGKYFASEICDYSMKISKANWDDIDYVGDVSKLDYNLYKNIDLLIGGSPCQNFSFGGKRNGAITKDKIEVTTFEQYMKLKNDGFEFEGASYLFWEYVRALKELKPKYFLLENVKMAKKWQDVISEALGVQPILIDSALVSAQHRERLYWTNIPNVCQPKDKNIKVLDILEDIEIDGNIAQFRECARKNVVEQYDLIINSDKSIQTLKCTMGWQDNKIGIKKAPTLRHGNPFCLILDKDKKVRPITVKEAEKLQTLPIDYTKVEGVSELNRLKAIGNGWTVDVISEILKNLK